MSILVSLCENGVNPEALAAIMKELKKEASARNVSTINNEIYIKRIRLDTDKRKNVKKAKSV